MLAESHNRGEHIDHIDEEHGQDGGLQDIILSIHILVPPLVDHRDGEEDEGGRVQKTDHRRITQYIAITI